MTRARILVQISFFVPSMAGAVVDADSATNSDINAGTDAHITANAETDAVIGFKTGSESQNVTDISKRG